MNAQVGLTPPRRHRRRRLPPQPAQDVLHPARRRRPGHGPDRRRRAPRAVPARATRWSRPAARRRSARSRRRRGAARASCRSRGCTSRMMGGEGLTQATAGRDPQRELHGASGSSAHYPVALHAAATGRVAHECILDCRALQEDRRHRGRGHRQAADGLRLPRADDVLPGRRAR